MISKPVTVRGGEYKFRIYIYIYIEREREREKERERERKREGGGERGRETAIRKPHGNYKANFYNRYTHKKEKGIQTPH